MTQVDSIDDGVDPTRISAGANESHLLRKKDNDEEDPEKNEEDPEDNEEDPQDNEEDPEDNEEGLEDDEDVEEDYGEEG